MNSGVRRRYAVRPVRGFSLIEVMIAVLILALGLLGFALLQTMNVRFAKSANQRTQATNLAYELLDQMRVNRIAAVAYVGNYAASPPNAVGCRPNGSVGPAQFRNMWQCRLQYTLGAGSTARVTFDNSVAIVTITWNDASNNESFEVRTRL
ncbi:type IV pilus modification protein PilV [Pseudoxanthomonas mexicana]|uniref:type IV pilus modification protein PilV n=1 Tax=Pseudoxanthomonas mexicana TaxID=128785 RepID=UPI00398A6D86